MQKKLLLITPPFTQLNTPYPATAYIKGFLNTKDISSYQCDLGIEVILSISAFVIVINVLIAGKKCLFSICENGAVLYVSKSGFFIVF